METAIYITIGTMAFFTIIGIPAIIWGIYDNKKREKLSQGTTAAV